MKDFKSIEYFNTNKIVSIHFTPEKTSERFYFEDRKPIKKFFGLINTGRFTQPGWVDYYDWDSKYTDEELRKQGYKVYTTDERINDRVCVKATVKVYLAHDNTIVQEFETDDEAEFWIENLKTISGKNFAVAIYKN
jgi:hypothetical protein